jgi:hypothetical protein
MTKTYWIAISSQGASIAPSYRDRDWRCTRTSHFQENNTRREPTHGWVAKFFYDIFTVGANWADEVGQIKAVLVAQGGCYQSQELGVSYGHESQSQSVNPEFNINSRNNYQLHNKMALQPSLRPLLIAGKPDAPHTLDVFRMCLLNSYFNL